MTPPDHGPQFDRFPDRGPSPHGPQYDDAFRPASSSKTTESEWDALLAKLEKEGTPLNQIVRELVQRIVSLENELRDAHKTRDPMLDVYKSERESDATGFAENDGTSVHKMLTAMNERTYDPGRQPTVAKARRNPVAHAPYSGIIAKQTAAAINVTKPGPVDARLERGIDALRQLDSAARRHR